MQFLVHIPAYPLSQFVERFWFYDDFFPDYDRERVLPSGGMELLIELRNGPKRLFDKSSPKKFRSFKKSWISGVQSEPIMIEVTRNSSMMGVTFKPGGAYPFFSFPLSEVSDAVVELDLLWGNAIHSVRDQILAESDPRKKFVILERFLLARAGELTPSDQGIHAIVEEILLCPTDVSVKDLANRLGASQTHLNRKFVEYVGIHPKFLIRLMRFQRALRMLEVSQPVHWCNLALSCGYYDQSHFIREFQMFSGYNPTKYLKVRGDYINFIPLKDPC